MNPVARSIVKYVDIQTTPDRVFAFLADPLNWPEYAVVNLRSVHRGDDSRYHAVTKFGEGEIEVHPVPELGVLDHVWTDPQATWTAYARVVPNGDGSTFMLTFFQPPVMTDAQFNAAMVEMDVEMATLKQVLER